jgi:aminoglycoside phosphotransferase (APT) family kinase protein
MARATPPRSNDWDMATRGDPLADLGTLMGSWFDPGEAPSELSMMPTLAPGWLSRDAAVRRYESRSGRDLRDVDWYLVFGAWKLGVILQQIYIRWLRGQTQDDRFATSEKAPAPYSAWPRRDAPELGPILHA